MVRSLAAEAPGAAVRAASVDQLASNFADDLAAISPDIVAHTAGPYQDQDYTVARACIAIGCHYIDLADGRAFVRDFHELDAAAREQQVLLVSGASTLPGLSSAVVEEVRDRFASIQSIETSIAPAHQTPRGIGTVAAVLSYCGKPFDVLEDGRWQTRFGWQDLRRQRYPDLGRRLSGACDVPDLALFPDYVEGLRTSTFHAALEASWEQLSLWLMAGLTRVGLIRSWRRAIPPMRKISDKLTSLGSDRGGMQMRIAGVDHAGQPLTLHWNLLAMSNHGPEIPCVPLLILVRKLAAGREAMRGAMPCLGLISLQEFDEEVDDLDIHWILSEQAR